MGNKSDLKSYQDVEVVILNAGGLVCIASSSTPGCGSCLADHCTLMWPVSAYLDLPFRHPGQIASSLLKGHTGVQWGKIKSLLLQ